MTESDSPFVTTPIEPSDIEQGFSCGVRALDDYFARHALANDNAGIGRAYVLRRDPSESDAFPFVLGFYTLSMALAEAALVAEVLAQELPKYPMPVALIGRLAVDKRAQGLRLGETLLIDALRRVFNAAGILGCTGVIVDAKNEGVEHFYAKYDFVTITHDGWPRRLFLPSAVARAAFADEGH
jgi:GNAT superfamily N-acetyltransferase